MARKYTNIEVAIWHDDDFRALSMPAQHLYFVLSTDPDLTYAGIADWRPKRIAGKAEAWLPSAVEIAAHELAAGRFIYICERTEEVLVRSCVRHSGALKNAKLAVSVANAVAGVASNDLRGIAIAEMQRAKKEDPGLNAWRHESIKSVIRRKGIDHRELDPFGPDLAPDMGRLIGGDDE